RAQAERELAHALERVARGRDALVDLRRDARRRHAGERLELDLERGQGLPDVVVQVAREATPLLLLHLEEPPRKGPQALLRLLEGPARRKVPLALGALGERTPDRG